MTNPFNPSPAPAQPVRRVGMTQKDVQVVANVIASQVRKRTAPLEKRIAALEAALKVEQAKVSDAIQTALAGYLDETPGDDSATKVVKKAMRETPERYADDP